MNRCNCYLILFVLELSLLPTKQPLLDGRREGKPGASCLQEVLQHPVHTPVHTVHRARHHFSLWSLHHSEEREQTGSKVVQVRRLRRRRGRWKSPRQCCCTIPAQSPCAPSTAAAPPIWKRGVKALFSPTPDPTTQILHITTGPFRKNWERVGLAWTGSNRTILLFLLQPY